MRILLMATLSAMAGAFAPASATPPSTYISSGKYRDFTCPELAQEARKVSEHVMALSGEKPSSSHPAAGTENVVEWPAALDDSDKRGSAEIAAKEQMRAIEDASIQSQCDIEFVRSTR